MKRVREFFRKWWRDRAAWGYEQWYHGFDENQLIDSHAMSTVDKIRESNRIERIYREPTLAEVSEYERFIKLESVSIEDLQEFVQVYQPGKRLRDYPNMDVLIGGRILAGGPHVRANLDSLLTLVNAGEVGAWETHMRYEMIHPFQDGNGRSGRMLWYWMMNDRGLRTDLGFLHTFYYQCLQDFSRRLPIVAGTVT